MQAAAPAQKNAGRAKEPMRFPLPAPPGGAGAYDGMPAVFLAAARGADKGYGAVSARSHSR
ncbi:hypothetical protein GCM10010214_23720 [Streptomyces abikoensis]|nr:hypothetical protein GCM10010214_23720 [Streptomyces abikoensis]